MAPKIMQRQWIEMDVPKQFGSGNESSMVSLVADTPTQWSFGGRILRFLGCLSVGGNNVAIPAAQSPMLAVGLVLTNNAGGGPENNISLFAADQADLPWLWRDYFPLPYTLTGVLDPLSPRWKIDWAMRGGKGTAPMKNSEYRLVFSMAGQLSSGVLFIRWRANMLVES